MNAEPVAPAWPSKRLVAVLENVAIARDTYRLRVDDPILARAILPGQFLMIRPAAEGADDPLLGRPFALYDVATDAAGVPTAVDVVYSVVGRGTAALAQRRPGERLSVWGPLGNGFGPPPAGPVIFVAGGIGQTPFLALGRWWLGKMSYGLQSKGLDPHCPGSAAGVPKSSSATLLYGVRTAALLAGVNDFRQVGIDVEIATDDGSAGYHGFVTEILARRLKQGERPAADRWLRLFPHARGPGASGRTFKDPLRGLAREPHGMRLRGVFQLRRPDPPTQWHDRPPPRLRGRACLRGVDRGVVGVGALTFEKSQLRVSPCVAILLSAVPASGRGSCLGAVPPARSLRERPPRRVARARSFRPRSFCGFPVRTGEVAR